MPDLFPYQEAGAAWLAQRSRAALLDRPRVGKTAQVIRGMDLLGHRRGIIVVPAVAREHWRRELHAFGLIPRKVIKGVSIHDFVAWSHGKADVLVTSYDMAVRWTPHMMGERLEVLDYVHFDEAHMLKSLATSRAKALIGPHGEGGGGLAQWGLYSWWVTGTPVPNDPMDIYTMLRHVQCMPLSEYAFRKRYFTSFARTYSIEARAIDAMLPELRALIANNSICRTLSETAPDLPPMFMSTYVVDGEDEWVREALRQHPGLDEMIREALEGERGLSAIDAPHIATLRRLIGEAKAVAYASTILGELESGLDKVVVFGHHRSVLQTVATHLTKHGIACGMITGDVSDKERVAVQDRFREDPAYRAVICNIRAAGVAINLTSSAAIDMLESDWAPRMNYQALMRVYGQTQKRTVRARFITLANSFDETIQEIIARKTQACDDIERPDPAIPSMAEMLRT